MAEAKPRVRVAAGRHQWTAPPLPIAAPKRPRHQAFDAGRSGRRLSALPTATQEINRLVRSYGRTVIARSRYLSQNNPYASQAKNVFVSALAGSGIKPSSLYPKRKFKKALQEIWFDWTDEADADGLTDFYGMQSTIAGEMFDAGECFVRLRARRLEDGLTVPLQLQLLPSEMLPYDDNRVLANGNVVKMGVEFDGLGRRVAYWFLRRHPGADHINYRRNYVGMNVRVPADEVLHIFDPTGYAGQIRGIPHTLSAIVTAAVLDAYDDAELERKRIAALFAVFIKTDIDSDTANHPLGDGEEEAAADGRDGAIALEPGVAVDLDPGQSIEVAEPADVGGNYESFQYRALLRMAAGFGVPYASMTGDLQKTSYGTLRGALVEFRRKIEAKQHSIMVFQFCRPVWIRWFTDAVMFGAIKLRPAKFLAAARKFMRVKWMTPKWEWIDPLKDLQAEKLAVDNGFKSRSDVVEANGYDPEETDARSASDKKRERDLGLSFPVGTGSSAVVAPSDGGDPAETDQPADTGDAKNAA